MNIKTENLKWTNKPKVYTINAERIEIVTQPHTDLWQRTYYHFINDNAPMLLFDCADEYFSFTVKTNFSGAAHRFDQCGIAMYLDSQNWIKCSAEYENENYCNLGSVVTNNGYSDWATTQLPADVTEMWFRLSRRKDDFCIECSRDGAIFSQMRVCHMFNTIGAVPVGVYACSPEASSFKAVFTDIELTECLWGAHDGQQPDYY